MQDLAAPLSQVLSDGTSTYLYGLDRLATVNAAGRTGELHDALGSVHLHLDDTGTPLSASGLSYTPFGLPQSGALPQPFGFAGELHSGDLLYLRAQWYDPGSSTFTSVDPFAGFATRPDSLHPYMYAANDPVLYTDSSGETWYLSQVDGEELAFQLEQRARFIRACLEIRPISPILFRMVWIV